MGKWNEGPKYEGEKSNSIHLSGRKNYKFPGIEATSQKRQEKLIIGKKIAIQYPDSIEKKKGE